MIHFINISDKLKDQMKLLKKTFQDKFAQLYCTMDFGNKATQIEAGR